VTFAAITLCVASQRVFIVVGVYFVMTQSGNFWIHPDIVYMVLLKCMHVLTMGPNPAITMSCVTVATCVRALS
jgi:hypothetical protein